MLLLLFAVHRDEFAIPAIEVNEVLPLVDFYHVPAAPPHLAGVINHRGVAVPVIDLGLLIGDSPCRRLMSSRILLIDSGLDDGNKKTVGLLAERVTDTVECPDCRRRDFLLDLPGAVQQEDGKRMIQWFDRRRLITPELPATLYRLMEPA